MPVMQRGAFADLLDPRFREVISERAILARTQDMLPFLWKSVPPTTPFRDIERYSELSGIPRAGQFTGSVDYQSRSQGYDVSAAYVEFAIGLQVERLLVEYDQFNEIDDMGGALFDSMWRRRQFDGQRFLRNAFSVDTFFYNHTEGVPLCSNSHTTTTGASTTAGFDNLVTTALSATNLATVAIQALNLRDLMAEPIQAVMDEIIYPAELYETAFEIAASLGKVDTAQNNRNVHYGAYTLIRLPNKVDFTDTNDWFARDSRIWAEAAKWFDQVWPGGQPEFGQAEEFDTFVAKWRAYCRYSTGIFNWRFIGGASVS
jgi:hypothetical protein